MAKDSKTSSKSKTEEKTAEKKIGRNAKDEGFKFGVPELADRMGVEPASARVALRKAGIEKQGSIYGWNSKAEMDETIEKCRAGGGERKSSKKDAKGTDKKSAKGKEPKAAEKKASKAAPTGKAQSKGDSERKERRERKEAPEGEGAAA